MNGRRSILLLTLATILAPLPATAQQRWRAGTSTVPGGVAYSMTRSARPASIGLSLRRSVPGGRWSSVKLQLSQETAVPGTSRLTVRTLGAQELFKAPHPTLLGVDVRLRVTRGLSLTGGLRRAVLPVALYGRGTHLTFGLAWRG